MRLFYTHFKGENNCFNPRTRKGCDMDFKDSIKQLAVSIHAPVKDATETVKSLSRTIEFQSTHP